MGWWESGRLEVEAVAVAVVAAARNRSRVDYDLDTDRERDKRRENGATSLGEGGVDDFTTIILLGINFSLFCLDSLIFVLKNQATRCRYLHVLLFAPT